MTYTIKADSLPLKIKMKKPSQSLIGANTVSNLQQIRGVHPDERGIPL
jgi:hypothetical protein